MFNRFFIIFLTILLPLTEGFLLAWYLKYIEPPPEPETERKKDGFGVKVPEINELPEEYTEEEQISEETAPEQTLTETPAPPQADVPPAEVPIPESTAEEIKTEESIPPKTKPAAESPFDDTEDVMQSVTNSGIMVNETIEQMFSDMPVEISPDLEKRIEENSVQQKIADGLPEEITEGIAEGIKESGNAFDLPDEEELLRRMTENSGSETAVKPEFETEDVASKDITAEDIAPSAVEVLGADFDFEALKNSISK